MKYGELNLGQVEAMVNKLGGMEGVRRFLAGELMVKGAEYQFKIWKTIKLGLHKSPEEYRKALKDGKCRIGDFANEILDKIPISQEEVEVDLVCLTGRKLGFKENARQGVIYNRALEYSLQKCPGEVGLALREQYPDQPNGEGVLIVMEPIAASDGSLRVFRVERSDLELWLDSDWSYSRSFVSPADLLVFVRPRK